MHSVSSQADGECSESLFSCSLGGQPPSPWQQLHFTTGCVLKQRLARIQHLQDLTEDNGSHTEDNSWLNLEDFGHHNATQEAKGIRKEFTEYVMKEGTVPWQWRSAHIL